MTLRVRNTILRLGLLVSLGLLAAYGYWAYRLLRHGLNDIQLELADLQHWLVFSWSAPRQHLLWAMLGIGFLGVFVPITVALVTRFFRKISAPEIFFFVVFVLTLSTDLFKLVEPLRLVQEFPRFYSVAATRVVLFGRLVGVFCLLASSLYIAGVTYQKTGTALGLAALIAFAFVYAVPVDSLTLQPNLIYQAGERGSVQIVVVVLEVLALVNCGYGAYVSQESGYFGVTGAMLMVILGRQLLFYLPSPALILAGAVLLAGGTALFGIKNREMYLWL